MISLMIFKEHSPLSDASEPDLSGSENRTAETGFSLVEVVIAMVVFLIALLGVFITFSYAVNYNAGNNSRAQALAVLQQEIEVMRSAKFTPAVMDNYAPTTPDNGRRDITGGVKAPRTVTAANGNRFRVAVTVDDNPATTAIDVNGSTTLKEITVTVTLENPTPGWQTSVPATAILRRVRAN